MILDEIVRVTGKRIQAEKELYTEETLKTQVRKQLEIKGQPEIREQSEIKEQLEPKKQGSVSTYPFEEALRKKGIHLICEVKKASPSKGIIAKEFFPSLIAKEYEEGGATAISVLTEPSFFLGKDTYLEEVKKTVQIPVLRKDFILDSYQIYQARLLGADCILLITSLLSDLELEEFLTLSSSLGMSALVETHTEDEVKRAISCGARLIGVNNRNLTDFTVSIENSIRLRSLVPKDILYIAESGIETKEQVRTLYEAGVNGVLIGETLMRSSHKQREIQTLLSLVKGLDCV